LPSKRFAAPRGGYKEDEGTPYHVQGVTSFHHWAGDTGHNEEAKNACVLTGELLEREPSKVLGELRSRFSGKVEGAKRRGKSGLTLHYLRYCLKQKMEGSSRLRQGGEEHPVAP